MRRISVVGLIVVFLMGGLAVRTADAAPNAIAGVCTMNITVTPTPGLVPSATTVSLGGSGFCSIDASPSFNAPATLSALNLKPLGVFGCAVGLATGGGEFDVTINGGLWRFPGSISLVSGPSTYTVVADTLPSPNFLGGGSFLQAGCSASSILGIFVFEDPTLANALLSASSAR